MAASSQPKRVVIIAGTTGVGESTVTQKIIELYPIFKRLVTATSRSPRLAEQNGVDYYFFSEAEFKKEIAKSNVPEYQNTRSGVYYGTYKPELEKQLSDGFNVIANTDIVGADYYKKNYGATAIFIMPDSFENLAKRIRHRQKDISIVNLQARLDYARHEIEQEGGRYDYRVVNAEGQLDKTVTGKTEILKNEGYRLEI